MTENYGVESYKKIFISLLNNTNMIISFKRFFHYYEKEREYNDVNTYLYKDLKTPLKLRGGYPTRVKIINEIAEILNKHK